jgi:hypothetical protein
MGIESVSYRFEPSECDLVNLLERLQLRGATDGDREDRYVLSGADYWIDLLVRASGSRVEVVQFRVAVTNPVSVVLLLHELVSDLLDRFGGRVTDAAGRRVLHDQDRFDVLMSEFSVGRERFTQNFGELTLPVSADQVFSRLRATSEKGAVGE